MKYHLHYVENCSPKLKSFETRVQLDKFIKKIEAKEVENEDTYVDFAIIGKLDLFDNYYKQFGKRCSFNG